MKLLLPMRPRTEFQAAMQRIAQTTNLVAWNDNPWRTEAEVVAVVRKAEKELGL